ncbi:CHAT domain-containing protein [Flammeovirga kamogawensis]|uniref:CHAT domain-containing protein n=1 Tax=Flammeovirga kamogawensis TaxID=373891 RepID=A0ABX8GU77_9BACT|nr:CHAT domain-containing tetratricopeptide repeat protein [Flammeovirga kamogawensis]MBB6459787.1 CHAT domain-containing protein [Flammeovirga kamogawensis]QWG07155.1 CHAT domain-containing protein [Flammeovirga kamogawensis]TRX68977.1 CHAT domain-containing protein [Flammeovirga kamogawensis]
MINKYTIFLLGIFLLLFSSVNVKADKINDKIDNILQVSQKYADDGEYKKAIEWNYKALQLAKKRDSALIDVLYQRARYQLALTQFEDFETSTNAFLTIAKKRKNGEFGYVYTLLLASDLYIQYSDIVSASNLFNEALEIMEANNKLTILAERSSDYAMLKTKVQTQLNLEKGFYTEAITQISDWQKFDYDLATSSSATLYHTRSNKFKEKSFSNREKIRLKRKYAFSLTTEGKLYRLMGDYQAADSILLKAENWIKENIRTDDESYIVNYHERTLNLIESKVDPLEPKKMLEKNIYRAERVLGISHKVYFDIQEDLVDYYAWQRFNFKGDKTQWDFDTNTSLYFGKNSLKQAKSERLIAKDYYLRGNFNKSLNKVNDVFAEASVPKNHKEYILINELLYKIGIAIEDQELAQNALNEYINATEKTIGNDALAYHIAKVEEATYFTIFTDKFELADSIFTEHLPVIENRLNPHHYKRLEAERERANYYSLMGQTEKAATLSASIKKAYADYYGEDHLEYASGLQGTAAYAMDLGNYSEADAQISELLSLYEKHHYRKGTQNIEHAKALETAARFQAITGQYDEATNNLTYANRLSKKSPGKIASSSFADTHAIVYLKKEYFSQAEDIINQSLEHRIERFGTSSRLLIVPYTQLARLSYLKGEYIAADSIALKAFTISEAIFGEDAKQSIDPLEVQSEIAVAMGNYEFAQEVTQKQIKISKEIYGDRHTEVAKGYTQLALIDLYMGYDPNDVLYLFKDAVDIIAVQLGKDNPVFAIALKNFALAKIEVGKYNEAEDLLKQANQIWIDKLGNDTNTNSAEIESLLGDLEMRREKFTEAQVYYTSSQKTYGKIFHSTHPLYIKTTLKRSQAYFGEGKYTKAEKYAQITLKEHTNFIEKYFPVLSAKEKSKYWQSIRNDYDFFYSLTLKSGKKKLNRLMFNYALETKPLLLSSSVKIRNQIINSGDTLLIKEFNDWVEKKEVLTLAYSMSVEQQLDENINVKALEREINVLEKQLSERSSIFADNTSNAPSWKNIQKTLKEGEAAVEIVRFRNFTNVYTDSITYAALIITAKTSSAPIVKVIPNGNTLEDESLGFYKSNLIFGFPDDESYTSFWKPIHEIVGEGTTVYLSSDGVYNQINLESIPVDIDKGDYIIDHNHIVLTSTTSDLLTPSKEEDKNMNISLFGNPVFYKDLSPDQYNTYTSRAITQLPGTYKEIKALDKLLRTEDHTIDLVYLNKQATETAVKELESPRVFHIATHGFFLDDIDGNGTQSLFKKQETINPLLRSGLLLTNAGDLMATDNVYEFNKEEGVLTAYEAMNLNFDNTELVVLSACETGKGDNKIGEGVYGLQRAFLVAGADNIIMSLFEVSDEATQKLMTNFYHLWLKEGHNKRLAFEMAKKELREEYPEPKYWGAFIMLGKI